MTCRGNHPEPEDSLVTPVNGPVAWLRQWGTQVGTFPDGCPGGLSAHYSLYYKGRFIAQSSTPSTEQAELLREIAMRLNEHERALASTTRQG